MTVIMERDGLVTTVTIDRPESRNAVDGPTAAALADAFRAFEGDSGAAVAVLTGSGGTSAPEPTSRPSAPSVATRSSPRGTGRWARPGCV